MCYLSLTRSVHFNPNMTYTTFMSSMLLEGTEFWLLQCCHLKRISIRFFKILTKWRKPYRVLHLFKTDLRVQKLWRRSHQQRQRRGHVKLSASLYATLKLFILAAEYICVFRTILTINTNCFTRQQQTVDLCIRNVICFLWGANWMFLHYLE
jgi:hypothetical protein